MVGIDPVVEQLPPELLTGLGNHLQLESTANAFLEFGRSIIDVVGPLVPAVKINIAYFERYHSPGVRVYRQLVRHARKAGLIVIGDVKRSDIGHTAAQYALGQLADSQFEDCDENLGPDAITVNAYLGLDGIKPFLEVAASCGKGIFALVRTSNPSATEIQEIPLAGGHPFYLHMAGLLSRWADQPGTHGFCNLGAVVGATTGHAVAELRATLPASIFLIPGIGAQGGSLEDCKPAFDSRGFGAVISASRSIIFSYRDPRYKELASADWRRAVEQATIDQKTQIGNIIPIG